MIVYIDMDDVLCDFSGAHTAARTADPTMAYPQAEYGFFQNLNPLPGAVDAVKALIASDNYRPYILTAPSIKNPLCYTEKRVWIENYFGEDFLNYMIISPDKSLLKGDFLIDDNTTGKGQDRFEGELLHFGSNALPHWEAVRQRLAV